MANQSSTADSSIDSHVLWAMGAGAIPLPILDMAAVTAIQLNMFKELCMIYQVDYNESFGKNLISSLTGATLAKIGASFIKAIPGVGSLLGGVPMVVLSGASTYGMGQVFKKHLEIGGMMSAFSFENAQKIYNEAYEKGKEYVEDLRRQTTGEGKKRPEPNVTEEPPTSTATPQNDVFAKLQTLKDLHAKGHITDEEYQIKKAKLLEEI